MAPHFYTRDDEVDLVMRRVRDEGAAAGVVRRSGPGGRGAVAGPRPLC